jgi:hypothetical protein
LLQIIILLSSCASFNVSSTSAINENKIFERTVKEK